MIKKQNIFHTLLFLLFSNLKTKKMAQSTNYCSKLLLSRLGNSRQRWLNSLCRPVQFNNLFFNDSCHICCPGTLTDELHNRKLTHSGLQLKKSPATDVSTGCNRRSRFPKRLNIVSNGVDVIATGKKLHLDPNIFSDHLPVCHAAIF